MENSGRDMIKGCALFLFRFLVDSCWMKQWKSFVEFDYSRTCRGKDPGPVDNSKLYDGLQWYMHHSTSSRNDTLRESLC